MTPNPNQIQLNESETPAAAQFFAACDEYCAGVRAAMEESKRMFLKYLISQRKPAQSQE